MLKLRLRETIAATSAIGALVCAVPALADPPVYSLTQVQLPAGAKIFTGGGGGINNQGDIALTTFSPGRAVTLSSADGAAPPRGFVWQYASGRAFELGTLGGTASSAFAINDCADVVGSASLHGDKVTHAALFRAGNVVDLDAHGAQSDPTRLQSSFAASINNGGSIVGAVFVPADNDYHPVSFQSGAVKDLTGKVGQTVGINLSGEIAGFNGGASSSSLEQGFVIRNGQLTTFTPDPQNNAATVAINDFGDVAGSAALSAAFSTTSFLFQDGKVTIPPSNDPMGGNQNPVAIDNSGNFVGSNQFPVPPFTASAFLVRGQVEYFLDQLVDPKDPLAPFVSLTRAFGINDSGWIAAEGNDSRDNQLHIYLLKRQVPAIQVKRVAGGCRPLS